MSAARLAELRRLRDLRRRVAERDLARARAHRGELEAAVEARCRERERIESERGAATATLYGSTVQRASDLGAALARYEALCRRCARQDERIAEARRRVAEALHAEQRLARALRAQQRKLEGLDERLARLRRAQLRASERRLGEDGETTPRPGLRGGHWT